MSKANRVAPNPDSEILGAAMIGGGGLGVPPGIESPPPGMAVLVLYVPLDHVVGKSPPEVQDDVGLPWHMLGSDPAFDEFG